MCKNDGRNTLSIKMGYKKTTENMFISIDFYYNLRFWKKIVLKSYFYILLKKHRQSKNKDDTKMECENLRVSILSIDFMISFSQRAETFRNRIS